MANVARRVERAEKHLEKGKLSAALEEYAAALAEDPENDFVRERAADLYLSLNQASQAAELFGQLFERYANAGRAEEAINTYRKLASLAPVGEERALRFANLIEKSSPAEALDAYQAALRRLLTEARKPQALAVMAHIVALAPTPENMEQHAKLAAQVGDVESAANCFLQLGRAQKDSAAAAEHFQRAFSLSPHKTEIAVEHARALLARGEVEKAISSLRPLIAGASDVDLLLTYAQALLKAKRLAEAEPVVWAMFQQDPDQLPVVGEVIAACVEAGDEARAVKLASRLQGQLEQTGNVRDLAAILQRITGTHKPGATFLEYLVRLYESGSREGEYCAALLKLFDLHFATRNYAKAAESLERAAEVDPYEPGHEQRLQMLRGKVDAHRFNAVANHLTAAAKPTTSLAEQREIRTEEELVSDADKEPTVLEDLMLQAEIFLQYSMKPKALERLQRINKLFPGEENSNEQLKQLYITAGFTPRGGSGTAPRPAATPRAGATPAAGPPLAVGDEGAINDFARINLIARNIARQSTVKSVLFTAVNDAGRHWGASRCLAGLCAPGKPPSAAVEYCAPGVNKSDIAALVKLVATVQTLAAEKNGAVIFDSAPAAPELEPIRHHISALGIVSLLAAPLMDGDEHAGILILEQCGAPRQWDAVDELVLKTIAEQMVLAVNNAKLRSLVKTLAIADEKSGLLKRSSYLDVLLSEVRRSLQQKTPVTVLLLKLGGKTGALVKQFGEPQVDAFIKEAAQSVTQNLRQNDVAIHYDLTTIALILPDTSDKNAQLAYEKFRKVLAGVRLPGRKDPCPLTAGIAEAFIHPKFDPVDVVTEIINRAEAALEMAKLEGGNCAYLQPVAVEAISATA